MDMKYSTLIQEFESQKSVSQSKTEDLRGLLSIIEDNDENAWIGTSESNIMNCLASKLEILKSRVSRLKSKNDQVQFENKWLKESLEK